jgi:hypothetical protein
MKQISKHFGTRAVTVAAIAALGGALAGCAPPTW